MLISEGEVPFNAEQAGKPNIEVRQFGLADHFDDVAVLCDTPCQGHGSCN